MNLKYILGGAIILVFMVWGAYAFMGTTVQYVSIDQAAASSRTVQVMGKIDFDAVKYDDEASRLEFTLYDPDTENVQNAQKLNVVYYGVVPGNFDQATSVVVKGKPDAHGDFVADKMFIKCPSKYQGEEGEYQDINKHNAAVGETGV